MLKRFPCDSPNRAIYLYLKLTLALSVPFWILVIWSGHLNMAFGLIIPALMWCPAIAMDDVSPAGSRLSKTRVELAESPIRRSCVLDTTGLCFRCLWAGVGNAFGWLEHAVCGSSRAGSRHKRTPHMGITHNLHHLDGDRRCHREPLDDFGRRNRVARIPGPGAGETYAFYTSRSGERFGLGR